MKEKIKKQKGFIQISFLVIEIIIAFIVAISIGIGVVLYNEEKIENIKLEEPQSEQKPVEEEIDQSEINLEETSTTKQEPQTEKELEQKNEESEEKEQQFIPIAPPVVIPPLINEIPSFYPLIFELDWSEMIPTAYAYELVIPKVIDSTVINRKSIEINSSLIKYDTTYSWKVRGCTDSTLNNCGNWSEIQYFKTRSEPIEPKIVVFEWEYKGESYSLTKTFYKSYYDNYNLKGKELHDSFISGQISDEDYYFEFTNLYEGDNTISEIVNDIKLKAQEAKITSPDDILEMALAFVQWIPYDQDKADYYYSSEQKYNPKYPRYPYETLYDEIAICTDASILGAAVAQELGYGSALFPFISEGHMTLGIKCPENLSSWNTGYCSTEMTGEYYRIGEIDNINNIIGTKTPNIPESLSEPGVFKSIGGEKIYQQISVTNSLIRRIKTLKDQIENKDWRINDLEKSLPIFEAKYLESGTQADYLKYEAVYDEDSQLWEARNNDIESYNGLIYEYVSG